MAKPTILNFIKLVVIFCTFLLTFFITVHSWRNVYNYSFLNESDTFSHLKPTTYYKPKWNPKSINQNIHLTYSNSSCAYVTFLYGQYENSPYILSLRILMNSFIRHRTQCDFIVILQDGVDRERQIELLTSEGMHIYVVPPLSDDIHPIFQKIHAWGLKDYDFIAMIDLDMLIRANIDEIFTLCPLEKYFLCGIPYPLGRPPSNLAETLSNEKYLTGGFLIFRPNTQIMKHMFSLLKTSPYRNKFPLEQDFFNWYGNTFQGASFGVFDPGRYGWTNSTNLLHFASGKPWFWWLYPIPLPFSIIDGSYWGGWHDLEFLSYWMKLPEYKLQHWNTTILPVLLLLLLLKSTYLNHFFIIMNKCKWYNYTSCHFIFFLPNLGHWIIFLTRSGRFSHLEFLPSTIYPFEAWLFHIILNLCVSIFAVRLLTCNDIIMDNLSLLKLFILSILMMLSFSSFVFFGVITSSFYYIFPAISFIYIQYILISLNMEKLNIEKINIEKLN